MNQYFINKLLKNISYSIKKTILNEGIDFSDLDDSSDDDLTDTIFNQNENIKKQYLRTLKISDVLIYLNINIPRGVCNVYDKNKNPVLEYCSNNKTYMKLHSFSSPPVIESFIKYLIQICHWKPIRTFIQDKYGVREFDNEEKYRKIYEQYIQYTDIKWHDYFSVYNTILISPDEGLILKVYNADKYVSLKNGQRYNYGWQICFTGKANYKDIPHNKKLPKKIKLNYLGEPLLSFTPEKAQEIYDIHLLLTLDILKYESEYKNAYYEMLEDFEKKYPNHSDWDSEDHEAYNTAKKEWEKWATKNFKLDAPEKIKMDKDLEYYEKLMKSSFTANEREIQSFKYSIRYYFKKKWIKNKTEEY